MKEEEKGRRGRRGKRRKDEEERRERVIKVGALLCINLHHALLKDLP